MESCSWEYPVRKKCEKIVLKVRTTRSGLQARNIKTDKQIPNQLHRLKAFDLMCIVDELFVCSIGQLFLCCEVCFCFLFVALNGHNHHHLFKYRAKC